MEKYGKMEKSLWKMGKFGKSFKSRKKNVQKYFLPCKTKNGKFLKNLL